MDNKVTMTSLAAMMALATGKQKKLCEDFLQELFTLISDELSRGESVRIKGLGTFKLIDVEARKSVDVSTGEPNEIPPHRKIIFVACKELAQVVNAPFEAFEAEEISDNLPTEELTGVSEDTDSTISAEETEISTKEEEQEEPVADPEPLEAVEESERESGVTEALDEEMLEAEAIEETGTREDAEPIEDEKDEDEEEDDDEDEDDQRPSRFGWGFLTGFLSALGVAALAGILWWGFGKDFFDTDISRDQETEISESATKETATNDYNAIAPADTMKTAVSENISGDDDVPTRPSDMPVLDTISTTRFLTTMAQDHYGNFNIWPIIYDENSKILGHPDRIKPGTQVVVPSLSKYGIDPHNPADINKMKERGKAIYDKYR